MYPLKLKMIKNIYIFRIIVVTVIHHFGKAGILMTFFVSKWQF